MGFHFRFFHAVPIFCSVPVFAVKTRLAFNGFQRFPIESNCGGIEKIAVKSFIFFVAFIRSQLIVVENMGSENKVVGDLFHFHGGTCFQPLDLPAGIRFPEFFNVFVDLRLDIIIPEIPVALLHCFAFHITSAPFYARCSHRLTRALFV